MNLTKIFERKKQTAKIELIIKNIEFMNKASVGVLGIDSDTILADILDNCDYQVSGLSQEIFDIWKSSKDKDAIEKIFLAITDVSFEDYLNKCIMMVRGDMK